MLRCLSLWALKLLFELAPAHLNSEPRSLRGADLPNSPCSTLQEELLMVDSYGDGWNGARLTFTTCSNDVISVHTIQDSMGGDSSRGQAQLCLPFEFKVNVTAGQYPSEISWTLEPLGRQGGAPFYASTCSGGIWPAPGPTIANPELPLAMSTPSPTPLPTTGYSCSLLQGELVMSDSFGDGWDGAHLTFRTCGGEVISIHTIEGIEAEGRAQVCLPAEFRVNVSPGAYPSEISWTLEPFGRQGGAPFVAGTCPGDEWPSSGPSTIALPIAVPLLTPPNHSCTQGELVMLDEFGDGWNGALLMFKTCEDEVISTHTLADGYSGHMPVCLPADFRVNITAGSRPAEILWYLLPSGRQGGAPYHAGLCPGDVWPAPAADSAVDRCEFENEPSGVGHFWDPTCQMGDLGCDGDGKSVECRLCGGGEFIGVPCPASSCKFPFRPHRPYFWDTECKEGDLGCSADDVHVQCRFCGDFPFTGIPCPETARWPDRHGCTFEEQPETPFYWDPSCVMGQHGCYADGFHVHCRFCGKGVYSDIACLGSFVCDFDVAPARQYYWDLECQEGMLGCKADGRHQECRFCGAPDFEDVQCPEPPAVPHNECSWPMRGEPLVPFFWDVSCQIGQLGCFADGQHVECRYCGVGVYSEVACPNSTALGGR